MIGIVLALLSAFTYGSSVVLIRKKLNETDFMSVVLVITVTGNLILWPFALLFADLRTVNLEAILFFVMAGILAPGIARLSYYKGMEVVGVTVNSSIFATSPMYSLILAVLLLGEAPILENWIGMICIVVGVVFIERSLGDSETGPRRISRKNLIFPIFASLAIAFSQVVRKHGLNICNEPLLGVAMGYFSTFLLYLLVLIFSNTTLGSKFSSRDLRLFWKAGVGLSVAWVLSFYALSLERISIVIPLMQTEPLFVLFFVHLYLREMERITWRLILSTLFIVVGIVLVSLS